MRESIKEKWKEQAKTLWQSVGEGFERGMESARKSAEALAKKAGETAQVTKQKLEIIRLEHQISRKFAKLGGTVYEKGVREGKKDPMSDPEVKSLINDLRKLETDLAQIQALLEEEHAIRKS